MRLAIIGCGSVGARHARNARVLGVDVIPVDLDWRRASRLAADLNVSGWSESLKAFDEVDAVMICTPANTHVAVGAELLRDGYQGPLFIEKPLASSAMEAAPLSAWPSVVFQVGYNWCWNPEVRALRERHQRNVVFVHLRMDTRMSAWPGRAYGDPLLECSHEIALVRHWTRDEALVAAGDLDGGRGIWLQWSTFLVDLRWDCAPQREYLVLANQPTAVERWAGLEGLRVIDRLIPSPESVEESYRAELSHFLDCAAKGVSTGCTFADGLAVLKICEQARALSGRGKIEGTKSAEALTG